MNKTYDIAVVGLGVMGSAIAHYLAKAGLRVIALERFWPNHERGSSSGSTRLIRKAHFELPAYVPLVQRCYELWDDVAKESGRDLLLKSGGLVIGSENGKMVRGTVRSAVEHDLDYRLLSNAELRRERPGLRVRPSDVGVFEKDTGLLLAESCVTAHLELAVRAGAELRFGAQVTGLDEVDPDSDQPISFEVNGVTMTADRVVVAAGPWTPQLLPVGVIPPLEVERIATYWFDPVLARGTFDHGNFPAVLWDHPREPFLIVPNVGGSGVKVAFHHSGRITRADDIQRVVTEDEVESMRAHLRMAVPELNGRLVATRVGMYTNTRDGHFAIGEVQTPRLMLVAACSGHGFKFAPVIGEIITDLVVDGATRHPIDAFRLDRSSLYKVSQMAGPLADEESSAETG